ncbi:putative ATP-dependent helicase [Sulfolobus islandicus L.S.2.15]|uniref:Putative ATP-dependent helicase n=1 Tax=Saccharolobus islandicus (strain L.S.2.15 / Lassen \|nr:ATP-dependent helicase [Sulfolobus islandicus]ACP34822.1 putative ATP-dependent helicase [Sulfolobus islandicus L.S.2.15]
MGNSALSFGIDVPNLDLGFVHSHDAETLIQRIGRFGRKGEGEAEIHVFLKSSYKAIKELKEGEIDYYELVDIIYRVYDKRIDDGLDKINFSVEREKILFRTFLYAYYIAQGSSLRI